MTGRGAAALCHQVTVTLRRARAYERFVVPPGYRAVVAIADTPDGPEEQPWAVPHRAAKQALNPRRRDVTAALAMGNTPPGWFLIQRP